MKALKQAVANVVEEHRRERRPLAIWRNGKVVHVIPELEGSVREQAPEYNAGNKQHPSEG